eukprot:2700658-Prymnesium_polylepis.1
MGCGLRLCDAEAGRPCPGLRHVPGQRVRNSMSGTACPEQHVRDSVSGTACRDSVSGTACRDSVSGTACPGQSVRNSVSEHTRVETRVPPQPKTRPPAAPCAPVVLRSGGAFDSAPPVRGPQMPRLRDARDALVRRHVAAEGHLVRVDLLKLGRRARQRHQQRPLLPARALGCGARRRRERGAHALAGERGGAEAEL